jgi:hypothetical protein
MYLEALVLHYPGVQCWIHYKYYLKYENETYFKKPRGKALFNILREQTISPTFMYFYILVLLHWTCFK